MFRFFIEVRFEIVHLMRPQNIMLRAIRNGIINRGKSGKVISIEDEGKLLSNPGKSGCNIDGATTWQNSSGSLQDR